MSPNPRPTLLIVDDDLPVLGALNELFSDDYTIIPANSGPQALEALLAHRDIRAVVLDVKMANMNGIDTYRAIKRIAPLLPIIIHTGDLREQTAHLIESLHPFACLQKGKSIADLLRAVHDACERKVGQPSPPDQ